MARKRAILSGGYHGGFATRKRGVKRAGIYGDPMTYHFRFKKFSRGKSRGVRYRSGDWL